MNIGWGAVGIAAGLTIPPLVALYFLKLKRNIKHVPTTLLWKKSVEDLRVNSPFQRLRSSLLLFLQLLVLALGAIALGEPFFQTAETFDDNLIVLIDHSASMSVMEEGGKTRLEIAKEQAKRTVENMTAGARAMVIAFSDQATVVSSFDTDKRAVQRKIDSIEETQSTSNLTEAFTLAEAYAQNQIIGSSELGGDIAPERPVAPASVFLFTDGRIEDLDSVTIEKFDPARIEVTNVATRSDNVGILAMDARRNYEVPQILEVTAVVRNFSPEPRTVDATLRIDGDVLDVITLEMGPAGSDATTRAAGDARPEPSGSGNDSRVLANFENIEFDGDGVIEVTLQIDDALPADDRAWTIVDAPKRASVLLVSDGHPAYHPIRDTLGAMEIELTEMTPAQYEAAAEEEIADGVRSLYDVVVFDRHTTERLPQGNYLFFGGIPQVGGVSASGTVDNEIIFNWDDTHPVLRHLAVETLEVVEWLRLELPPEAVSLVDGATSPVMSYLARDASQFLIVAFGLVIEDAGVLRVNTYWPASVDFVIFLHNAVNYLAANIATTGQRSVRPGEPVSVPLPEGLSDVEIVRPNNERDRVSTGGSQTLHYSRTRLVGAYEVVGGVQGRDRFAVNLFSRIESNVAPADELELAGTTVSASAGEIQVSKPAWPYFLLALLALLMIEWVIYNYRVFV